MIPLDATPAAFVWTGQPREKWPDWTREPNILIGEFRFAGTEKVDHLSVHTRVGIIVANSGDTIIHTLDGDVFVDHALPKTKKRRKAKA